MKKRIKGWMTVNKQFRPQEPWYAWVDFSKFSVNKRLQESAGCLKSFPCTITYETTALRRAEKK